MAFSFDSTDDCVEYTHNALIDLGTSDFCIVMKVWSSASNSGRRWLCKGTSSGGTGVQDQCPRGQKYNPLLRICKAYQHATRVPGRWQPRAGLTYGRGGLTDTGTYYN